MWGSIRRTAKTEKDQEPSTKAGDAAGVQNQGFKEDDSKQAAITETKKSSHSRKNSEISLHFSVDERSSKLKGGSLKGVTLNRTPEILLTDCDEVTENVVPSQTFLMTRSRSEPSLTDVEKVDRFFENQDAVLTGGSSNENIPDVESPSHVVRIDIEGSQSSGTRGTQLTSGSGDTMTTSSEFTASFSSSTRSSDGGKVTEQLKVPSREENAHTTGEEKDSLPRANFLTGMAKTFHQWRTKTKKKRKFNYEKYIIYLESILPTVGFSIGGVIITFNGIYTFIVVLTFLVGVFAQEAFFGN